jgi:hypothetical protein
MHFPIRPRAKTGHWSLQTQHWQLSSHILVPAALDPSARFIIVDLVSFPRVEFEELVSVQAAPAKAERGTSA